MRCKRPEINELWSKKSVNECTVQQWFQNFLGIFILENKEDQGFHSEVNDNILKTLVQSDPRTIVPELAVELG